MTLNPNNPYIRILLVPLLFAGMSHRSSAGPADPLLRAIFGPSLSDSALCLLAAQNAEELSFHAPDSAMRLSRAGADLSHRLGYRHALALNLNAYGNALFTRSDYAAALEQFASALRIGTEMRDTALIAAGFLNIGNVNFYQRDFGRALDGFKQSIELGAAAGDSLIIARASVNIGAILVQRNETVQGLRYLERAAEAFSYVGDRKGLAYALRNMAIAHQIGGRAGTALSFLRRSLQLARELNNTELVSGCLQAIADIHRQRGEYRQSIASAREAYTLARTINDLPYVLGAATTLAAAFEGAGDHRRALEYTVIAAAVKDSILDETRRRELRELQHRHELESKETEIALLEQQASNQQLWTLLVLAALAGAASTAGMVYRSYRKERAGKERLAVLNDEKQRLIGELTGAMEKIRTLGELLPVCCNCKSVRDDQGYWQALDRYISSHTDTKISHGICPECMEKLYPDIAARRRMKAEVPAATS